MARASAGTPTLIRPCNDNSRTAPYACVASRGEIVEQALNNDQIVWIVCANHSGGESRLCRPPGVLSDALGNLNLLVFQLCQ